MSTIRIKNQRPQAPISQAENDRFSQAPYRLGGADLSSACVSSRNLIAKAMQCSDDFVVIMDYLDSKGQKTRRVVSPIRFVGQERLLALCLCRCEPRQFHLKQCSNIRMGKAADYLMPVQIQAAS